VTVFGWLAIFFGVWLASLALTHRWLKRNAMRRAQGAIFSRRRIDRHVLRRF
jgi:hypothetical protein